MEAVRQLLENEPVVIRGVLAVIQLLVAIGIEIDQPAIDAIVEGVSAAVAVGLIFLARNKVTPVGRGE